uniref:Uncharacterized protein n=1 Tax=uncultured bacterium BLR19 TaxID=506519 RepID=C0INZ3_9BACT|nr:hypothetical protein AKSOIL_0321 [uncultured bacterium BLR19]
MPDVFTSSRCAPNDKKHWIASSYVIIFEPRLSGYWIL